MNGMREKSAARIGINLRVADGLGVVPMTRNVAKPRPEPMM